MNPITARKLLFGFAVVVSYGSIYPANFQIPELGTTAAMQAFLATCCGMPHSGDVLANILLFIPFGFLGMLSISSSSKSIKWFVVNVLFWGVLLALALQLIQIYLPSRNENLQDAAWNFLGILIGVFTGLFARNSLSQHSPNARQIVLIPWVLISAWLAYRLIPFVPALDFQEIKDSIKPLFLYTELIPKNVAHDTVAWCLVAYFLRYGHRSISFDVYLPFLILITFLLEIIIVSNSLSFSNIVGAGLAIVLWWGVLARIAKCEYILAAMLFVMLAYSGLEPFVARVEATSFNWLPFKGFLGGSMYVNTQSVCEKSFLYGSLVYMLWRRGLSTQLSTVLAMSGIVMIEFLQTYFIGEHTPEVTDPILVLLIALMLFALKDDATAPASSSLTTHSRDSELGGKRANARKSRSNKLFLDLRIDLRPDQVDFLKSLSEEMGISISQTIRRIVDTVIQETQLQSLIEDNNNEKGIPAVRPEYELVACMAHLRVDQFDWLNYFMQCAKVDLSCAIRKVIDQFIEDIEKT